MLNINFMDWNLSNSLNFKVIIIIDLNVKALESIILQRTSTANNKHPMSGVYAVCCMLYAVCCMLYAVCCMLYAVCCSMLSAA